MTTIVDDVHGAERALDLIGSYLLAEQEAADERLHAARYRALKAREDELDAKEEFLRRTKALIPHRERCLAAQKELKEAKIITAKADKDVYAAMEESAAISRKISAHILGRSD